jgi:hypothetical protein
MLSKSDYLQQVKQLAGDEVFSEFNNECLSWYTNHERLGKEDAYTVDSCAKYLKKLYNKKHFNNIIADDEVMTKEDYFKTVTVFAGQERVEKYSDIVEYHYQQYIAEKRKDAFSPRWSADCIFKHERVLKQKEEFQKANAGKFLKRGCRVADTWGATGVVTKILPGTDLENHGAIYVWRENDYDYGADNCEHYSAINWRDHLKILEMPDDGPLI